MSTYNNQAAESMRQVPNVRRPSHGSSTGAPGFPTGSQDTRSQYDPATSGVNPATGAGYQKHQAPPVPARPSNSYDQGVYDAGTHTQQADYPQHAQYQQQADYPQHAQYQQQADYPQQAQYQQHAQYPQHASAAQPTGTQPTGYENQTTADSRAPNDKYAQKGEDFGRKAHGVMAGVHGAGESLRGALTGAVDRAFGTTEGSRGAVGNEEVARQGEREIQTGEFTRSGR